MEKKIIKEDSSDNNNLYTKVQTIEKDFDDGFVHEASFHEVNTENYGKYHKGPEKAVVISTNDPRITRPFLKIICGIFFVIGLFLLLIGIFSSSLGNILFGIFLIIFISVGYKAGKRPIDEIEKQLKENEHYDDSKEGEKAVQKEFVESINNSWKDVKQSTFTKNNLKKFTKATLPIYCLIALAVSMLLAFLVNLILGIVVLIILVLCGLLYYWIISKFFKW